MWLLLRAQSRKSIRLPWPPRISLAPAIWGRANLGWRVKKPLSQLREGPAGASLAQGYCPHIPCRNPEDHCGAQGTPVKVLTYPEPHCRPSSGGQCDVGCTQALASAIYPIGLWKQLLEVHFLPLWALNKG